MHVCTLDDKYILRLDSAFGGLIIGGDTLINLVANRKVLKILGA